MITENEKVLNEYFESLEILNEENDESEANKQYIRIVKHMLKYKYEPSKQGSSWFDSISNANIRLNKIYKRSKGVITRLKNNIEELNICYTKAVDQAVNESEGRMKHNDFPNDLKSAGVEFTLDFVMNRSSVKMFLNKYFDNNNEMVDRNRIKLNNF